MHDQHSNRSPGGGEQSRKMDIRSFEVDDPFFENLVRLIVVQCSQFAEHNGGQMQDYYIGMGHDVQTALRSVHHLPQGSAFMIRDGLDRFTARAVIQEMIRRGCAGDDRFDERDPIDLYLFRMIPGITKEDG